MTDVEIVSHIRRLFDPATSPGQAFDALFALRQARVMYSDVFNAIPRSGNAQDENHYATVSPKLTFKNPVLNFGKYAGKTLLEVCDNDPSYVRWLAENGKVAAWREQASLALIELAAAAPLERDTDATGYFDA